MTPQNDQTPPEAIGSISVSENWRHADTDTKIEGKRLGITD